MIDETEKKTRSFFYRSFNVSAPEATVLAAAVALVSGALGAAITGSYSSDVENTRVTGQLDLERLKFQTGLILKAIDTTDHETAVKTLKFFAQAGLIPAYEEKISSLASKKKGSLVPAIGRNYMKLSDPIPDRLRDMSRSVGKIFMIGGRVSCTAVLLENNKGLTLGFCRPEGASEEEFRLALGEGDPDGRRIFKIRFNDEQKPNNNIQFFEVEGAPSDYFQGLKLSARNPRVGEQLAVIHYPQGGNLRISLDRCFVVRVDAGENGWLQYHCKTDPGSGGAPVISLSDFSVVAIHSGKSRFASDNPDEMLKDAILTSSITGF